MVPVLVLTASSFAPSSAALFANWTTHYWAGLSTPSIAQGAPGIAYNPEIVSALVITLGLGCAVALAGMALGLVTAYTVARHRGGCT